MAAGLSQDLGRSAYFTGFNSGSAVYRLDLSTVDANIDLPSGLYYARLMSNDASVAALVRYGATAAFPANGGTGAGFIVLGAGGDVRFQVTGGTVNTHAILSAGTATMYFVKVF